MASLFNVSIAASLALHATALLAGVSAPLQTRQISVSLGASEAHLSKVLQRLVKAGVLRAKRGPGGGFELARPAEAITLKQIYEAIEGPIDPCTCPFGVPLCTGGDCPLGDEFRRAAVRLHEFMAGEWLSDYRKNFCVEVSQNA